jgi:acetoin utilization deacetylase AcuC-like enzyme
MLTNSRRSLCLLNDQAIHCSSVLLNHKIGKKDLIIDPTYTHQGNGTFFATIPLFLLFLRMAKPIIRLKETDLDIAFDDGNHRFPIQALLQGNPKLIEKQKPDFIFYLAGVDILASDKLGKLGCTIVVKEMNWFLNFAQNTKSRTSFYGGGSDIKTIEAHA